MPVQKQVRTHVALCLLGSAITSAACSDQSASRRMFEPDSHQSSTNIQPIDSSIDTNDTWVAFDAERRQTTALSVQDPIVDSGTDQPLTHMELAPVSLTLRVEGGYDSYGTIRVNEYRQDAGLDPYVEPADETRRIQIVGDGVTEYDAAGQPIAILDPDDGSALADVGSLAGAQITEGVVIDARTYDGTAVYQRGANPSLNLSGGEERVERVGTDRIRIVTPIGDPADAIRASGVEGTQFAEAVRTYVRRGDKLILEEVDVVSRVSTAKAQVDTRQTLRISNVVFHENKSKDAERRALRERTRTTSQTLLPPAARPLFSWGCEDGAVVDEFGNLCNPGGGGDGGSTNPCDGTDPNHRNVVLQHGIFSSGDMWSRMSPWLSEDFHLGCKLVPSLSSTDRLASQAEDLGGRVNATGKSGFLLIGHSQGGLISRHLAQRSNLVNGVVTVGTPHQGARLVRTQRVALTAGLSAVALLVSKNCFDSQRGICGTAAALTGAVIPAVSKYAAESAVPAFVDLQHGGRSEFLNNLNGTPEGFTRVGIQSYPKKLFVEWRLYGDFNNYPEALGGGRRRVRRAQRDLALQTGCSVIGFMIGATNNASACVMRAGGLLGVSLLWNLSTAKFDRSDGIVEGKSQVYPNANQQYPIPGGDSHVGEGKSDLTRERLQKALRDNIEVTAKRAF